LNKDTETYAVPVNVEINADSISQLTDKLIESSILGAVSWLLAAVSLRARIRRSTSLVRVPAKLPVAIDVATNACLVWC
jgi:hypothetical protein